MKPISLTLKGFCGIRDGLGRDELHLDFEKIIDGAQLIAIAGNNGRGKTTIMDNMTPFPTMPSRAGADGLGSFSYYDHVCLPENIKDLIWEHDGRRYRSQMVFRVNGRKKTEAFLHEWHVEEWHPVVLPDGTVSDGKLDTYTRCVESILGSAETFFTSAFSAQGRRQLSAYKNAEIKTLLADLLGLDQIRELGVKASETAKLLKTGLHAIRQERAALLNEVEQVVCELHQLGDTQQRIATAQEQKTASQNVVDAEKESLANVLAQKAVAMQTETRRTQLHAERRAIIDSGKAALAALDHQEQREAERLAQLDKRIALRAAETANGRKTLLEQYKKLEEVVRNGRRIEHAVRRLPMEECIAGKREARVNVLRQDMATLNQLAADEKLLRERIGAVEREAGQAALKAQELAKRFGLTAQVPCAGTNLQGQCKLLGDANEAKSLMPSADAQIVRLEEERRKLAEQLAAIRAHACALRDTSAAVRVAEARLRHTRCWLSKLALRAARQGELTQANETLAAVAAQIQALPETGNGETDEDKVERSSITQARQHITHQRTAESKRHRTSLDHIDTTLAALPTPFDDLQITQGQRAVHAAQQTAMEKDAAYMTAVRDQQRADEAERRKTAIMQRLFVIDERTAHVEKELGGWMLFAKCMSNDGLIALSIDDAGPTLSALANDLLLACYGHRFTVSIKTQIETGKGEAREGFDIVVHDADSGDGKSVTLMSGGERVWINECLTRAIALYLTQNSGRRYETLFSDEADGPLDPERKRMFMTMKREVLRLGGYGQEFFVSQTTELTAMADAVIDLDAMMVRTELAIDIGE
jgi:exonuclease SbcC